MHISETEKSKYISITMFNTVLKRQLYKPIAQIRLLSSIQYTYNTDRQQHNQKCYEILSTNL